MPTLGLDRNSHSIPATAGGDRIGQQEHRLIDGGAAHDFVGHHRKEQPRGQRQHGDRETEHCGDLDRGEVERIGKDGVEILEPDKSPRCTDCRIACPAGQKKTKVTASCGASNSTGNSQPGNTTRRSI